jgi:hypothetical protein
MLPGHSETTLHLPIGFVTKGTNIVDGDGENSSRLIIYYRQLRSIKK